MNDPVLYPYAFKATVSSGDRLESRIHEWFKENNLVVDIDYETRHFEEANGDFNLLKTTYIFDSKAHAVFFKLTFGGKHDES